MAPAKKRTVLEGVPKVAFAPIHDGQFEFTPFPSCLKAVCGYLGQQHPYHYLLGACGGAFRLLWHKDDWFAGSVDLFFMEPDPLLPFRRGLEAAGWKGTLLINDKTPSNDALPGSGARFNRIGSSLCSDEATYRERIVASIDAGRPVIAFGVVGPPEASIVTGYDDAGDVLVGWSMFQDHMDPEHDLSEDDPDELNPPAGIEESGYYRQTDWFRRTFGIITLDEPMEADTDEVFLSTARWIPEIILRESVNEFHTGLAAYDAYIAGLADDSLFASDNPDALTERKLVHYDAMTMIAERSGGAKFVEDMAKRDRFSGAKVELSKAARCFEKAVEQMAAWWEIVGPIWADEEAQVSAVAKPDIRSAFIPRVAAARDADREAAALIKSALEKIG